MTTPTTADPSPPPRHLDEPPAYYGMGWRWVQGAPPKDGECHHCTYGGPRDRGRATADPSGKPVAFTAYRPAAAPHAFYACADHVVQWEGDKGVTILRGVWRRDRLLDGRGLPVDLGHLHLQTAFLDVEAPSARYLAQGAMAAVPGLAPCPWCRASCETDGDSMLAVCTADPAHRVVWVPWGG